MGFCWPPAGPCCCGMVVASSDDEAGEGPRGPSLPWSGRRGDREDGGLGRPREEPELGVVLADLDLGFEAHPVAFLDLEPRGLGAPDLPAVVVLDQHLGLAAVVAV